MDHSVPLEASGRTQCPGKCNSKLCSLFISETKPRRLDRQTDRSIDTYIHTHIGIDRYIDRSISIYVCISLLILFIIKKKRRKYCFNWDIRINEFIRQMEQFFPKIKSDNSCKRPLKSKALLLWSTIVEKDFVDHILLVLNWWMSYNSFKQMWLAWAGLKFSMSAVRNCLGKNQTKVILI
jgi:hypothetical protein